MIEMVVGVDLGGTRLRTAWARAAGPPGTGDGAGAAAGVQARGLVESTSGPAPRSVEELVSAVAGTIAEAVGGADESDDGAQPGQATRCVVGLGITVPGLVDGTTCRWVPNLAFLDGVDLAAAFAHLLPADAVVVANDAHLALLAEATDGAASGASCAILLAIGTGIGSAVMSGGRIERGANGAACSFGWACADVGDRDGTGGRDTGAELPAGVRADGPASVTADQRLGWLERHASGAAIDRAGASLDPPRDGAALVDAARRGDASAAAALDPLVTALGTTLAGAVALLDPSVVIITGGVADAFDVMAGPLRHAIQRHLPPHLHGVDIRPGRFGRRAGIIGALAAARRGQRWWEMGSP